MCGLCVEACPTRALTLTSYFELAFESREDAIWTKEQLLEPPPELGTDPVSEGGPVGVPLDNVVFWVFAPISVAWRVGMLLMRNAVHAALFLVVNFFCLAVFFLILDAPFLFAVQIIVYAGAIMVLFLFVIMLLGVDRGDDLRERLLAQRPLALALAAAFVIEIAARGPRRGSGSRRRRPAGSTPVNEGGNAQALADGPVPRVLLAVRGDVVLLIIAAIAAMVLAQRKARAVTQAELAARSRPSASRRRRCG